jgi:nucleoside 2-deoxyribosyltransferase
MRFLPCKYLIRESNGISPRPEDRLGDELEAKGIDVWTNADWVRQVAKLNKLIVKRDIEYIDSTDATVAFMQEWSGGTTCEIFYTGNTCNKPVFLITTNLKIAKHPWMIEACSHNGRIFKSINSFKRFMRKNYGK